MAVQWRDFLQQWSFFTGDEKALSQTRGFASVGAASSFQMSLRAYVARHFGHSVFTADAPRHDAWLNSYIVDGDVALQKASAMDAAIQRSKSSPPMTIYQLFKSDIDRVEGKIDLTKFKSAGLEFLTNKLSNNHLINPAILRIKELEKKLDRLIKNPASSARNHGLDIKHGPDIKPSSDLRSLGREMAIKNELKIAREESKAVSDQIRAYLIQDAINNEVKSAESVSGRDDKNSQAQQRIQAAVTAIKNEHPHDFLEQVRSEIATAPQPFKSHNFNSVYLDYLVEQLCENSNIPGNPQASLNPHWQALKSLTSAMYRDHEIAPVIESEFEKTGRASNEYTAAIRNYLIKRIQSEIKHEVPIVYAYPRTRYAMYQQQCEGVVKPLPPPTTGSVIGLRFLNPLYLLDAVVGGVANGVARFFCGVINSVAGEDKNGIIASILKLALAGPSILIKMATSAVATAFSVSSWVEPERVARVVPVAPPVRYEVKDEVKAGNVHETPTVGHRRQSSTYISTLAQPVGDAPKNAFTPPPLRHAKTGIHLPSSKERDSVSEIEMSPQQPRASVVSSVVGSEKKDGVGLFGGSKHRRQITRGSYPAASAAAKDDALLLRRKK